MYFFKNMILMSVKYLDKSQILKVLQFCFQNESEVKYVNIAQQHNLILHDFFVPLLSSFKNGSLTRERIKDDCAEGSWEKFSEYLTKTPTGNNGNIGKCQFRKLIILEIRLHCTSCVLEIHRCVGEMLVYYTILTRYFYRSIDEGL